MGTPAMILISMLLMLLVAVLIFLVFVFKGRINARDVELNELKGTIREMEDRIQQLELDRMKLYGVVSHDIRGPYNRIFALLQLVQMSANNLFKDQTEYIDKIHILIADSLLMIRNLNDSFKLEGDGIEYNPTELAITPVLGVLARNHKVIAEKKNVLFHAEIPSGMMAYTDKHYLVRILDNVLSNAIKFSAGNNSVYMIVRDEENGIHVEVRDEGPGIKREDQSKIFQRFSVLSSTPTCGETTTGLGLYVSKIFAEKMGAQLSFESKPGAGTTFVLQIWKRPQLKR